MNGWYVKRGIRTELLLLSFLLEILLKLHPFIAVVLKGHRTSQEFLLFSGTPNLFVVNNFFEKLKEWSLIAVFLIGFIAFAGFIVLRFFSETWLLFNTGLGKFLLVMVIMMIQFVAAGIFISWVVDKGLPTSNFERLTAWKDNLFTWVGGYTVAYFFIGMKAGGTAWSSIGIQVLFLLGLYLAGFLLAALLALFSMKLKPFWENVSLRYPYSLSLILLWFTILNCLHLALENKIFYAIAIICFLFTWREFYRFFGVSLSYQKVDDHEGLRSKYRKRFIHHALWSTAFYILNLLFFYTEEGSPGSIVATSTLTVALVTYLLKSLIGWLLSFRKRNILPYEARMVIGYVSGGKYLMMVLSIISVPLLYISFTGAENWIPVVREWFSTL